MKIYFTILIGLFILSGFPLLLAVAQDRSTLSYADDLFHRHEYYRAISEYDRYLFFQGRTRQDSSYCTLQILKCYLYGQEYKDAIAYGELYINSQMFKDSERDDLLRYLGLSYLKMGFPKSAMLYFERSPNDLKSIFLSGVTHLQLLNWDQANERFRMLSSVSDSTISSASKYLAGAAVEGNLLPRKNPILAGLMSTLVPGAGYVYTKSYQTGIFSLALNLLLLGSGYELQHNNLKASGGFFFLIGFGWYIGNIYGSYMSAIKYNESLEQDHINNSMKRYEYLMK